MTESSPLDKAGLLEALADARLELLYLERKAREGGDIAAAARLGARGEALKGRIADLRALSHAEWAEGAKDLSGRLRESQKSLEEVLRRAEKREKAVDMASRVLAALDDVLSLTGKVLK